MNTVETRAELRPNEAQPVIQPPPPAVVLRRPFFPAINWGAVIAGLVVGLALQLTLTLLGIALGLTTVDVGTPGAVAEAAPAAAGWQALTMLIAAFIGGYVAARMSGLHRRSDGILHGFVAWGVTTVLLAAFATSALGVLFGDVIGNVGRDQASAASWLVFASVALSLLLGVSGGAIGVRSRRLRTAHARPAR